MMDYPFENDHRRLDGSRILQIILYFLWYFYNLKLGMFIPDGGMGSLSSFSPWCVWESLWDSERSGIFHPLIPQVSLRLDLSQEPRTQFVFFMWETRTQVFEPSAAPHVAFQNGMQAYQVPDTHLSPQGFGRGVFW